MHETIDSEFCQFGNPSRKSASEQVGISGEHDLTVQRGKMMVEVLVPGHNKGTAITALMQRPEFAGTQPVFIGDDLTDECGFAAVRALGGTGILVGSPRSTSAQYHLPDSSAVRAWLAGAVA